MGEGLNWDEIKEQLKKAIKLEKNDKLIVVFGVIILILASIGIYFWESEELVQKDLDINNLVKITGKLSHQPAAITVSDSNPFYALCATPIAINYCEDGIQHIIPMYIKNTTVPSNAVLKVEEQIGAEAENYTDETNTEKAPF